MTLSSKAIAKKAGDGSIIDVGARKQLFLDSLFHAASEGTELIVQRPKKSGQPIFVADSVAPWEARFIGPYCTIFWDDGRYRMWYESHPVKDRSRNVGLLCYAESEDGVEWKRPDLGIIAFNGTTANNIVYPTPGEEFHGGTVFKDPIASPHERYKLIFAPGGVGVYTAYSPDGLRWTLCSNNPILLNQSDTQNVCFWDEDRCRYVWYGRLNVPRTDPTRSRTIGRSETECFSEWPVARSVIAFDENDPDDMDIYTNAASKYPLAGNAYIILMSCYHHEADTLDIQLATSRDGVSWNRLDRKPFIPLGASGSFDSGLIHSIVGQFRQDDTWWIYYRGSDSLHGSHGSAGEISQGGTISRASLRVDGYVALEVRGQGWLETPLLGYVGDTLRLNLACNSGGHCVVELQDADGRVLPGYGAQDCDPVTGDDLNHIVTWGGRRFIRETPKGRLRIRFELNRVNLYAFGFTSSDDEKDWV